MRVIILFFGLSTITVIVNGKQEKIDAIIESKPEKIVSDQEILFPASLLDITQLQSVETQIPEAINPTIPLPAEKSDQSTDGDNEGDDDEDGDNQDDSQDDDDDSENGSDDEFLDEEDWVGAADQPALRNIQKQNQTLTTSWSVSGSSSYPIVIDTDFVFNPITLAPESSKAGAAPAIIATAKPGVRNKKKVKSAVSAVPLNTLPIWSMTVLLPFIASFLTRF